MNKRPEFENNEAWHSRGFLPHYDVAHRYQMITYRLADSLPQEVLAGSAGVPAANDETQRRKFIEKYLDKGYGSCVFKEPACAQIVVDAWKYFDRESFEENAAGKSLTAFIRSLMGMDRQAVEKAFADYLDENNFNSKQIDCINIIIKSFVDNGFMEKKALQEQPFKDFAGGFMGLYGNDNAIKIVRLINELNDQVG